ncbi:MAG: hypothetical protein NTW11_00910 [Candidatus Staskawiczbacteria bacterium]|nr:hypothetical protein [Candidatus Staskawiczbacteria bacterium]
MKRLVVFLMAGCVAVVVAGCAGTGDKGSTQPAPARPKVKRIYHCQAHDCPGHANPQDRCGSWVNKVWVDKQ